MRIAAQSFGFVTDALEIGGEGGPQDWYLSCASLALESP